MFLRESNRRKDGKDHRYYRIVENRRVRGGRSVQKTLLYLGKDFTIAEKDTLYRCHDRLLRHKTDLFKYLQRKWEDLFGARFDVLLYDLTSTYFESNPPFGDKRQFGYSRDKRGDCVQVVIALVVTPEGFPLAYEVMPGNTQDKQTLRGMLGYCAAIWRG